MVPKVQQSIVAQQPSSDSLQRRSGIVDDFGLSQVLARKEICYLPPSKKCLEKKRVLISHLIAMSYCH